MHTYSQQLGMMQYLRSSAATVTLAFMSVAYCCLSGTRTSVACSLSFMEDQKALVATLQSEEGRGHPAGKLTLTVETTPLNVHLTPNILSTLVAYTAQHSTCMKQLNRKTAAQSASELGEGLLLISLKAVWHAHRPLVLEKSRNYS